MIAPCASTGYRKQFLGQAPLTATRVFKVLCSLLSTKFFAHHEDSSDGSFSAFIASLRFTLAVPVRWSSHSVIFVRFCSNLVLVAISPAVASAINDTHPFLISISYLSK